MNNQENIIILWISDIHYRFYNEETKPELYTKQKKFIETFLAEVKVILEEKKRIDYVILSGDIAFSGDAETYKQFWNDFIDPFYEVVHAAGVYPKILTIPGNHDVNWAEGDFIGEYLSHTTIDQKNVFLSEKLPNFEKLFASYSNSFSNNSTEKDRQSHKKLLLLEKENTEIKGLLNSYSDKRLFGFYIDRPNNILFILLNSAWYSLGSKFDKVIAEHFLNITTYSQSPATLVEKILETKNQLTEYNGQIIGRELFRSLNLIHFLDNNPGLFVVTCMHHPRNWMAWDELYSINVDGLTLNQLLERTNILLTGHEHVPESVKPETINEAIHYKAGVFLEDNINHENKEIFIHNRFSVFEIGNTINHPHIKEIRYRYDNVKKKWRNGEYDNFNILKRRSIKFNIPAITQFGSKLSNFKLSDYISEELLHQKKSNGKPKQEKEKEKQKERKISNYKCKHITTSINGSLRLYICPAEIKNNSTEIPTPFFELISSQPGDLLKILKLNATENSIPLFCTFLVPDVLVNWEIVQDYNGDNYEQNLNKLTKLGDAQFNVFREAFFSYVKSRGDKEFKDIMNIRFVNHIVPYRKLERYLPLT